jgi:transposase
MLRRHAITDDNWDRIKDLLPGQPGQHGKVAKDNRLFVDAVLWIAKTGAPWRDLPERFGNWNSTWRRFDRWARKGVWQRVFDVLQDPDLEWLILDSTVVRAHSCAAGAEKKWDGTGGQDEQALGRSRGGFGTKVHVAVNGLGLPVELILTPGQAADVSQAEALIEDLPVEVVIADKGYDSKAVVEAIEAKEAEAVIPSRKNQIEQRDHDRDRYKDRNLVERFWSKAKQYRRVATRYDKTARNFLAFIHVASIMILLQ